MTGPKNAMAINKTKLTSERLAAVEQFLEAIVEDRTKLVKSIQDSIDRLQFINSKTAEVIEGIITALGSDFTPKFETAIKSNKLARDERIANVQKNQVAEMVKSGQLKPATTISVDSLIVGREIDETSSVVHPGYQQAQFSELDPKIQAELEQKPVGTVVSTLTNSKFEVTEIYDRVPQAASENSEMSSPANA